MVCSVRYVAQHKLSSNFPLSSRPASEWVRIKNNPVATHDKTALNALVDVWPYLLTGANWRFGPAGPNLARGLETLGLEIVLHLCKFGNSPWRSWRLAAGRGQSGKLMHIYSIRWAIRTFYLKTRCCEFSLDCVTMRPIVLILLIIEVLRVHNCINILPSSSEKQIVKESECFDPKLVLCHPTWQNKVNSKRIAAK